MNFFNSLLIGIISGVISSFLVFIYWQMRKPKLIISKEIAKNEKGECWVKIVNKSRLYTTNIKIRLLSYKLINGNGSTIYKATNYDLPHSELLQIAPYKRSDKEGKYAIRLVLPREFEEKWDDKSTNIRLIIYCSNEFNTASKLFEQVYYKKNCIKKGVFECNKSMRIIEEVEN